MCNERFSNLNELIAHSQMHHTGSADICPHCRNIVPPTALWHLLSMLNDTTAAATQHVCCVRTVRWTS